MSDIKVLIVVDGVFNLTTTYPLEPSTGDSPDGWFTVSFLMSALRNSTSPTFLVDTASRGFSPDGLNFPDNTTPDPNATLKGPDPSNPIPFRFDDPSVNLLDYDEIWLFGDLGYDGGQPAGPQSGNTEPGCLSDSELLKITEFMQAGGGVFAVGDHDGLGAGMCGFIPRVRYMRKWFDASDNSAGLPPSAAAKNWSSVYRLVKNEPVIRMDTLVANPIYDMDPEGEWRNTNSAGDPVFFFDDQSDDIPQKLNVLVPSHPVVQGATGVLSVYPDHMHEGEVIVPAGPDLEWTSATDDSLSFAGPNFTEFPSMPTGAPPLAPIILAQGAAGSPPHGTSLFTDDTSAACKTPFAGDTKTCQKAQPGVLAAYDGHIVNVGRIVTDSSFHHFLDLNLLGDPCSTTDESNVKVHGFSGSTTGQGYLKEFEAFYVNIASWLAGVDRKFYFGFGKNNYGRDEVQDNFNYPAAFYVFLEGYTPNVVGSAVPIFSGSFNKNNIPGLSISAPTVTYALGSTGANANLAQRIRFEYEVQFNSASLSSPTAFPAPGGVPNPYTLSASLNLQGQPSVSAEFFLLGGDDPYFTNINETAANQPYLSQDLRVFTITPTAPNQTPISSTGASPAPQFKFHTGSPTNQDTAAAYSYIQNLITWLNQNFGYLNTSYTPPDTNVSDPLNSLLPKQSGALNGDSSVTPYTGSNVNYNFAIARVRLKGSSGASAAADNVKVFFRLFTTQTFDTDFIDTSTAVTNADPQVTYPSAGSLTNPSSPLPGTDSSNRVNGCSLPFFATANNDDTPTDYNAGGPNNQKIEIPGGQDYAWAFFGCFLNVNDPNNQFGDLSSPYGKHPVQYWLAGSAHNCLVAQIAYQYAPIENENGVIENPENSDKLAQRNLQVTTSGNPGFPATHRVPQTIDIRPSPPGQSNDKAGILSYPDEIMVDWGKTPVGSVASIYWPEVSAESVVQLAARLYPTKTLSAVDANTIKCEVVSPVTYIPIPVGAGGSFAGLLTVDLPASVRNGDEFDIVVRRITTRQVSSDRLPQPAAELEFHSQANGRPARRGRRAATRPVGKSEAFRESPLVWRYITGSFLVKIPVQEESTILPGDENLLAILKWRLGLIGPGNRWYPVLLRYISYLSDRIDGMGGNASAIPASPAGYQPVSLVPVQGAPKQCYTGKVIGIRYDRFGDFEGFIILSETGHEHWFRGREHEVEEVIRRAWIERTRISVFVESHDHDWPASIILRQQK